MHKEIVELFKEKWKEIRNGEYYPYEQCGKGTYHTKRDLERLEAEIVFEWSDNIAEFMKKYKRKKS